MKKRILACIVCLCVVLSIAPTIVFAEVRTTTKLIDGSFIVESKDGEEFTIDGNDIIINQAGTYYVTGSTSTYRLIIRTTDETIVGTVTIVLNGATIKPTTRGAAIGVAEECAEETKVTIMLSEGTENEVSGYNDDGISNLGRKLKIVGDGTLYAKGGSCGAGIGGGQGGNGSNITISDNATVYAKGGDNGAGIGGGSRGNGSNITISDNATVNVTGGKEAAGIGGGRRGNGSNITISGNARVYAEAGDFSAGIGGGSRGNGSNITISDHAIVNATSTGGAGIGGGFEGNGSNITISGSATVNATGGQWGSGIGGGQGGNGSNITISDHATVNAKGLDGGAGIGGGEEGNGSNITISGDPTIQVTSGENGVGFGNGFGAIGESKITISGGTITTLSCIPFSDRPDLSNYNGGICKDRRDDSFISYAYRFVIIPGA